MSGPRARRNIGISQIDGEDLVTAPPARGRQSRSTAAPTRLWAALANVATSAACGTCRRTRLPRASESWSLTTAAARSSHSELLPGPRGATSPGPRGERGRVHAARDQDIAADVAPEFDRSPRGGCRTATGGSRLAPSPAAHVDRSSGPGAVEHDVHRVVAEAIDDEAVDGDSGRHLKRAGQRARRWCRRRRVGGDRGQDADRVVRVAALRSRGGRGGRRTCHRLRLPLPHLLTTLTAPSRDGWAGRRVCQQSITPAKRDRLRRRTHNPPRPRWSPTGPGGAPDGRR